MVRWGSLLCLLSALAVTAVACSGGGDEEPFRIVGYAASWSGSARHIQYEYLTHVNYAFVLPHPSGDGRLLPVQNPIKLEALVEEAHQHGVKVLIAVGGWNDGNDQGFELLASDPQAIERFVEELTAFCDRYNLDGVDIDWEYPDPGESAQHYAAMMKALSEALHEQGRLLTTAVVALGDLAEGIPDEVFEMVDFVNIMAYDGGNGPDHSPYSYAEAALDYWLGRGLPPKKAVLGVPFYARPSWAGYTDLVRRDPEAPWKDQIEFKGGTVYYNGIPTIQAKTRLAMERAGGVMIWELSQDTTDETSLLRAIYQTVYGETSGEE